MTLYQFRTTHKYKWDFKSFIVGIIWATICINIAPTFTEQECPPATIDRQEISAYMEKRRGEIVENELALIILGDGFDPELKAPKPKPIR